MIQFLLDTNICIYLIKNNYPNVRRQFEIHPYGEVGISSITLAEMQYGVAKSPYPERNALALEELLFSLSVLEFDAQAALAYGRIRADLERKGTPIGALDMLIAGHAVSLDIPLVTNNCREFERVPGLQCLNWV